MPDTQQVIWDDQPKPPPVSAIASPEVQWDDEAPAPTTQPVVKPAPVQVTEPKLSSPEQQATLAAAKANIAQYPENQPAPNPEYVTRKNAFEAVQGEPGAPQDFQYDPEQERLIKAQAGLATSNSPVPQAAVPALRFAQTHVNEPLARMAQAGTAYLGREAERSTADILHPGETFGGTSPEKEEQDIQRLRKEHPAAAGVSRSVGGTIGGMAADPRMWPFFFSGGAAPVLQRAATAGFATQMAHGAYEAAGEFGSIMDNPDVPKDVKWEAGANLVLTTIMAAQATAHTGKTPVDPRALADQFSKLSPEDQEGIRNVLRQKAPEVADAVDKAAGPQQAAPQVTWDDQAKPAAKPERFRLPRGASAQEVQGPVKGPNIRTVQVGDKTYAFDQRKINADGVKNAVEKGELWRLAGGKAPEAAKVQAEQDIRGEEPAPEAKTEPAEQQAAPEVQWDDQQAAKTEDLQAPNPKPVQAPSGENEAPVVPQESQTTQNLPSNEGAKHEVGQPERRTNPEERARVEKRIEEMSPEEKDAEINTLRNERLTSEKTGLPGPKAFHADTDSGMAQTHPHVGFADIDDFKDFNTTLGEDPVDEKVLPVVGDVFRRAAAKEPEGSVKVYHRSGDEFWFRAKDKDAIRRVTERVNDELKDAVFTAESPDGKLHEKRGAGLSHGTGTDTRSAEADAKTGAHPGSKEQRKLAGQRVGARDLSERVGEEPAAGKQTGKREVAAQPERPAEEVKPRTTAPAEVNLRQEKQYTPAERIQGQEGTETKLLTPSGSQPARYRVVESADLKTSHSSMGFAKNPAYPEGVQERQYHKSKEAQTRVIQQAQNYDPAYTINTNPDAVNGPPVVTPDGIVLGGNSRAMSTDRLYRSGRGNQYKGALLAQAEQFGLNKETIRGMTHPVLVRELTEAPKTIDELRRLGSDLNKSMTGALGVNERAASAGKSVTQDTLAEISRMVNEGGEGATLRDVMRQNGKQIVQMMVQDGVITDRERPQFVDTSTGGLSDEGKTFVERALMGSVVDEPGLMDRAPKAVLAKLEGSLADIASLASRTDEYNLLPLLRQALEDHAEIAQNGSTVEDHLAQTGMFAPERNAAVDAMVRALAKKPREFREAMKAFSADANHDVQGQGGFAFGEKPSASGAFNAAFGSDLSEDQFTEALLQSLEKGGTIGTEKKDVEREERPPAAVAESLQHNARPTAEAGRPAGSPEAGPAEGKVDLNAPKEKRVIPPTVTAKADLSGETVPAKAPTFFSKAEQVAQEKLPNTVSADQVMQTLRNAGVKEEQLKWLGLDDYLKGKQKVSKADLLDYIKQNDVKVQEVVKGESNAPKPTKQHNAAVMDWVDKNFKLATSLPDGYDTIFDRIAPEGKEWAVTPPGQAHGRPWAGSHPTEKAAIEAALEKFNSENSGSAAQATRALDQIRRDSHNQEAVGDLESLGIPDNLLKPYRDYAGAHTGTKFSGYQLPGGENYRELLLKLPQRQQAPKVGDRVSVKGKDGVVEKIKDYGTAYGANKTITHYLVRFDNGEGKSWTAPGPAKYVQLSDLDNQEIPFRSGHFDEPNVLAHVRFNDRISPDGKKTLFIEEVQSDWHQKGRKQGYQTPEALAKHRADEEFFAGMNARSAPSGVPDAPFKSTWHELAMKRMLRYAAENGYDRVAWTTGEQQAARYDLSKHVDRVEYNSGAKTLYAYKNRDRVLHEENVSESKLADYIGKEAAQKLLDNKQHDLQMGGSYYLLEGDGLKVGGEGMKGFYDKILPDFLNKYGKKWGAKVSTVDIGEKKSAREPFSDRGSVDKYSSLALDPMNSGMSAAVDNDKVRKAVVARLPVDVVDLLSANGLSPEDVIGDLSVLSNKFSVDEDRDIKLGIRNALSQVGAELRTGLNSAYKTGLDKEILPTLRASDLDTDIATRIALPKQFIDAESSRRTGGGVGASGANTGAVAPISDREGEAAKVADFRRWHEGIVDRGSGDINKFKAWGVDITPSMRRETVFSGQTLFTGLDPALASKAIVQTVKDAHGIIQKGSSLYHGAVDKFLNYAHMGQTRPEIRKLDDAAADLATKMDAGGQYHKAMADMIGKKVTGPLIEPFDKADNFASRQKKNDISRDRMKGFHFLADAQNREWLEEHHPEDFHRWSADPKIKEALDAYKPFEEQLRSAVKQLGGKTIDEDYIKRIMDFATSGVAYEKGLAQGIEGPIELRQGAAAGARGGGRDNVVSPQIDRSKSRKDQGQYYWDHGVYDFGPSFEKRWVEVMSKLDEHRLAVHAMSMGTRIAPDEEMPEKVFYNGQEFYRPDMAKEIRDVQKRGVSAESKDLADALGVSELPAPKNVREYSVYEPLRRGSRFETAARNLAANVLAGKEGLEGQAANLNRMAKLRYALPKEIVEALNDAGREKELGALSKRISQVIGPLTQFIRQQIVGLAYGVPHMANILRKVVQAQPGAALNPVAWANAFKVAFSKELKARGISGTEDPTYDMLLKNAAISEGAVPQYKHYVEGNFNPTNWEGLQEAGTTAGNAFRKGGKEGAGVTPLSAAAGLGRLAIEPLNRFSEAGHRNLFKPGGIDQRARIWLGDFLKDRYPGMGEQRIAHEVNQTLGRYNRASWTDVQRNLGPLMLFPGWDYSSMAFALKHPFKTAVAPAVLMLLANAAVHAIGGNKNDEKNDLERVHIGKYSVRTNLMNDNFGTHLWGWALRGGKAALDRKNAKETTGEIVKGIPGDVAGVTASTMNPLISAPLSVAYDRVRPGGGPEIAPRGDFKKKGVVLPNKAAEDYGDFALRRMFPIYDRATQAGNRPSLASFAGLAGVNVTEKKKKKH